MMWRPLFGQDSSPQFTSSFFGYAGSVVFWLVFLLCAIFIKPGSKKPKFETVQIVLDTVKYDEKKDSGEEAAAAPAMEALGEEAVTEEASAEEIVTEPAPEPAVPEPVVQQTVQKETPKAVEKPVVKEESKPAAKKDTVPAKPKETYTKVPEFTEYAKDYSEMDDFFGDTTSSQTEKNVDWDKMFDEASTEAQTVTKKVVESSEKAFEGSAATTTDSNSGKVTSTSSTNKTAVKSSSSTSTSQKALSGVKNQTYSAATGDSLKSIANVKASSSSDGKISMEMSDGTTRLLLEPSKPSLTLSKEAAAQIDSDRTVTISFTVTEGGNVPSANISITPSSILPSIVQEEIKAQLSTWRFEPSAYRATATFEYTIKIK